MTLDEIGLNYRTDKTSPYHNYTPVYDHWFTPYRESHIIVLEIGLGDINSQNREGESLYMWRDYFPNAIIIGIDNDENKLYHRRGDARGREKNIYTTVCDQTDEKGLNNIVFKFGRPKIIIDDGSHIQKNTIKSFEILFPLLQSEGLYCIEDTVTSYWPSWGGSDEIFHYSNQSEVFCTSFCTTIMSYMLALCHYINLKRQETFNPVQSIKIPEWTKEIESISFYHSQIIIKKK